MQSRHYETNQYLSFDYKAALNVVEYRDSRSSGKILLCTQGAYLE